MKQFILLSCLFFQFSAFCQTYNPYYASVVSNCSFDSVETYLNEFTNFGIKELGTTSLDNTKSWIIDKYSEWGYTDIIEDSFVYSNTTTSNVIITKQGSLYPNTYLIIDGHYDTRNGPGSNDNGSGTAIILEMARLLKDVETEYSIKFIHFSGEEDGLIGSQHYVDSILIPQNQQILLVYNIDEVGGVSSMVNDIVVCERDESAPSSNNIASNNVTNTLAGCIELYSNLATEISYAYASDYMPFQSVGEVVTGLFEKNESPFAHTIFDDMSNLDINYIYEISKGALGGALEFAIANEDNTGIVQSNSLVYKVLPNPTKGRIQIQTNDYIGQIMQIEVTNILGRSIYFTTQVNNGSTDLDFTNEAKGIYFLNVRIGKETSNTKFLLN